MNSLLVIALTMAIVCTSVLELTNTRPFIPTTHSYLKRFPRAVRTGEESERSLEEEEETICVQLYVYYYQRRVQSAQVYHEPTFCTVRGSSVRDIQRQGVVQAHLTCPRDPHMRVLVPCPCVPVSHTHTRPPQPASRASSQTEHTILVRSYCKR